MQRQEVVLRICRFPRRYRDGSNLSPREIYDESGYADHFEAITLRNIEECVERDRTLIRTWLGFSDDKRWSPAWFFQKDGRRWRVGYFTKALTYGYDLRFDSGVEACAFMVRMEMEELRLRRK